ncbi:MAG: NAD(P)-binding domain-containing protein [Phycisphaerae bacterium]|nr:NAD(P)-binding domain-containing protein [Phycisphaerae bacterium]
MKILIADKLSDQAVSDLGALGAEVVMQPDLTADDLPNAVGDAEVLVVRSTKVTTATIEAAPRLSLIIRAGAGVNTIDVEKASAEGVYVTNCPGKNCDAVAELAIGLMIAADRRIVDAAATLRAGKWQKKKFQKSRGLLGRTFGVIGLGKIGLATARRAAALGMAVIATSRSLTPEKAEELGFEYAATPEQLAAKADVVSVHLAATPETKHLVNAKFLAAMKDGAIFINASRGEIVDSAALAAAIESKNLRVGLDVYENEPTTGEADFGQTELAGKIACTPHIGASTDQAAEAIAAEVVRIVRLYQETGTPPNAVNVRKSSDEGFNLIVRHFNRVGVLAGVLDRLRNEDINIEEVQNTIFQTGQAACCTLVLDNRPADSVVAELARNSDIIDIELKEK